MNDQKSFNSPFFYVYNSLYKYLPDMMLSFTYIIQKKRKENNVHNDCRLKLVCIEFNYYIQNASYGIPFIISYQLNKCLYCN